jgi:arabinan endo-1,5-alpha-L-arabinosidase
MKTLNFTSTLTRRQFLQTLFITGAGLTVSRFNFAGAQEERDSHLELTGSIKRVHDPCLIKDGNSYYLFSTGPGIPMRTSKDFLTWELTFPAKVFAKTPDWIQEKIPNQNDFWAPDIAYFNGKYHLYYAVSTFGKNRSVIGLATNTTLDSKAEDYQWNDEGLVLESSSSDNYNCIDPNFVLDTDNNPWLAFGSFWSGIKLRRLDAATGKPSQEDTALYSLASRTVNYGAVEAPFIIYKNHFYYLFVSFDFCCKGEQSSYHVRVGRSETITGPYLDRDGAALTEGGGTQLTFPTEHWRGPGHNAIFQENGMDYIVYHAYDAESAGVSALRIAPLAWNEEGWPGIQ